MKGNFRRATMIGLAAVFLLAGLGFVPVVSAADSEPKSKITLTIQSSSNATMYSMLEINDPKLIKELSRAKNEALSSDNLSIYSDLVVTLTEGQKPMEYRLERSGNLWNESTSERLLLSAKTATRLLHYAEALHINHYGQLLSWDKARNIVTRKSIVTVTDLETGLSFRVQRRAGSSHADVQPIAKEDSATMKQIYNGKWSWRRRAILVHTGKGRIAASMNGMPHGGDGIPDNGFSGHFCIHFLGSTSHRSEVPDTPHQLMVYKAAGQLGAFFESASPLVLAESFIEAMNQHDTDILKQLWPDAPAEKVEKFSNEMESLESIRINLTPREKQRADNSTPSESNGGLSAQLHIPLSIHRNGKRPQLVEGQFTFHKPAVRSPWRFEDVTLGEAAHSSLIP